MPIRVLRIKMDNTPTNQRSSNQTFFVGQLMLLLLLISSFSASAQYKITGSVFNSETEAPIVDVQIFNSETKELYVTNGKGVFNSEIMKPRHANYDVGQIMES